MMVMIDGDGDGDGDDDDDDDDDDADAGGGGGGGGDDVGRIQRQGVLLVACDDGWLYMFSIEPLASGSECSLLFQHRSV